MTTVSRPIRSVHKGLICLEGQSALDLVHLLSGEVLASCRKNVSKFSYANLMPLGILWPVPAAGNGGMCHSRSSWSTYLMTWRIASVRDSHIDTHSRKVNQRQRPGPTDLSEKSHNPAKKRSVMTVVPCTLGHVRDWDTVDDNVQSKKK